jgi:hypothetical protein
MHLKNYGHGGTVHPNIRGFHRVPIGTLFHLLISHLHLAYSKLFIGSYGVYILKPYAREET